MVSHAGDCGRAVFSDDKAGRGGIAPSRVAGPIPALRCGDLLGRFSSFIARLNYHSAKMRLLCPAANALDETLA
jgi:hypothetical protein